MRQIKKTIEAYLSKKDGNFAVWFAIMAFPLLAATSLVIDYRTTEANTAGIKTALDTAVLAAVSNESLDKKGKEALAKEIFEMHYTGNAKLKLAPKATDGRVEMTASGDIGTTVGRAVGYNKFDVSETSIAEMNRENTICVLALATSGKEKVRFIDSTKFDSPTCAVQSNSRDAAGILSDSRYTPRAKSFCSAGGASGPFNPAIRGECRVIDDPYAERLAPSPGVCMPTDIFKQSDALTGGLLSPILGVVTGLLTGVLSNGHEDAAGVRTLPNGKHEHYKCDLLGPRCDSVAHNKYELHSPVPGLRLEKLSVRFSEISRLQREYGDNKLLVTESSNYTVENGVYSPGTYCGGLTVDAKNVIFLPGTYIMKDGPLTFKNGATASAQDVSFVMTGVNSVVTVESGSKVNVKAPKSGPMAGLAFFQDKSSVKNLQDLPSGVNLLSSGGELNVTGTMYFPTQALEIIGDSVLGAKAPATSFIAHQVTFAGSTKAEVSVDHVKGDIPPMLPRSDDGARLVK